MDLQAEALLSAVRKGEVDEVSRLIEQGVDVNGSLAHRNGNTALHTSVLLSNEEITKMLLKAGADMNLKNDLGFTPLNYGLDAHRLKIGEILIKAGGDINATNRNGVEALDMFMRTSPEYYLKNITAIVDLLQAVPRSSLNDISVIGMPLMHFVFEAQHSRKHCSTSTIVEFIQTFVKFGFDINVKDEDGNTILHELLSYKCRSKDSSLLRCLLESGADPNAKNDFGWTPLHNLRCLGSKRCNEKLKLLAEYKTDFNTTDNHGMTPLHYIVSLERCPKIVRKILKQRNIYGETALDITCLRGFETTSQKEDISPYYRDLMLFIEYIDVNAVDSKGRSLLPFEVLRNGTWKFVIQHIALIEALDNPINQSVYNEIHANVTFKEFFTRCQKELILAKKTYLTKSSSVTYFHLLTGTKYQLKNYSGNSKLMRDFLKKQKIRKLEKWFPIYGNAIKEKVHVGIELRQLFDKAVEVLSREIPIFNQNSLIIHDTLDCILNKEDLSLIGYVKLK